VNAELQAKVVGLEQANDDLRNLMDSTEIAMVFVDDQLRVKRFTPAAQSLVPLIASDVGRPLADISTVVDYPDLLRDAGEVLRTLVPVAKDVKARDDAWYSVRIRPYRTARNAIDGLSMTFVEVGPSKRVERETGSAQLLNDVLDTLREPFLLLDDVLEVVRGNRAFYETFELRPDEVVGCRVYDLGNGQWDVPRLRDLLDRLLPESTSFQGFVVEQDFPVIGHRRMILNAQRVERAASGLSDLVLLAMEDATERSTPQSADERSEEP
jgi:PAS domain-containing protein